MEHCYLKGPPRFYSLKIVDIPTTRYGIQPSISKTSKNITNCLLEIWRRLGIPDRMQVDNALGFHGSNRHPGSMGLLIRMCLYNNVEPWFIPMAEPWRNGTVEHFNNFYRQMFPNKVFMTSKNKLDSESLAFGQRHNSSYRYSKTGGKTPLKVLAERNAVLRFPEYDQIPKAWHEKPATGKYHLVRLIRSDLRINLFNEHFPLPPELEYEYVVATVDVKEQKLKLFSNKKQVEQYDHKMRLSCLQFPGIFFVNDVVALNTYPLKRGPKKVLASLGIVAKHQASHCCFRPLSQIPLSEQDISTQKYRTRQGGLTCTESKSGPSKFTSRTLPTATAQAFPRPRSDRCRSSSSKHGPALSSATVGTFALTLSHPS